MAYRSLTRAGDPGAPTLVMLHGTGGDKESFATLAPMLAPGAGVLSLDGDVLEGGAQRFFRRTGEGVYDMPDLARRTAQLATFLDAHAPGEAVGVGYSNGANILANLAITGYRGLRRLVLMHPLIPFAPDWPDLTGIEVLVTAGERDPIGPRHVTQALIYGLRDAGAGVQAHWHPGGHELVDSEIAAARAFLAP
ncbi:MAG: alpha/beta hydrolase [Pseudomonadota bacterium]